MSVQTPEIVDYNGTTYKTRSLPFHVYIHQNKLEKHFVWASTALLRGYVGKWEIKDDKLWLVELLVKRNGEVLNVFKDYFPENTPVFASWYSGYIVCPQGKIIEQFSSFEVYKEEVHFKINKGQLEYVKTFDNEQGENEQVKRIQELRRLFSGEEK
jgi:hypothetical protein